MKKNCLLTCILLSVTFISFGQDPDLTDLSLEELLAVDLSSESLPIKVDANLALNGKTINIGLILPITKFKDFSEAIYNGARMAVSEINQSGGLLGKNLFLIPADDASATEFAIEKSKELIGKYKVKYIIGPTSSSRFIEVVDNVLVSADALIVSTSATAIELTTIKDRGLAFRTAASDALQGQAAASFAANNLQKKTAAIFYLDNVYGRGLTEEFRKSFEALGGKIISQEKYSPMVNLQSFDVTERLQMLMKTKPDILYIISNEVDMVNISKKLNNPDLYKAGKPLFMGTDALKGKTLIESGDLSQLDGMYGTAKSALSDWAFIENYKNRYGKVPTYTEAADAYDIVYLMAISMLAANTDNVDEVAKQFSAISRGGKIVTAKDLQDIRKMLNDKLDINYTGISGEIDFDDNGDVTSADYEIWQIKDGKFVTEVKKIRVEQ